MIAMTPKTHVLIVEDSVCEAALMRGLLKHAGYSIALATNGKEAIQAVREHLPAIVVTDLRMPEMDGLQLISHLRQEFSRLPIVLTTGDGSEDIAAEALHAGATSYVPKHFLSRMLAPTIDQILSLVEDDSEAAHAADSNLQDFQTHCELCFELNNDTRLIPSVIARLQDQIRQFKVCEDNELMQIAMALDEALLNAMIHGNLEVSSQLREVENGRRYRELAALRRQEAPYRDRKVRVRARTTRNTVEFVIDDEGPGFDITKIPDPTDPANLAKASGRGLLLINAFMDEVHHNATGNQITMVKRKAGLPEHIR
ncbi:MAG: ATP-binding protein [Planctomycetaceae bacterium]|nr:ATP-binding protein [Planctomycetaceae bacterium]